MGIFSRRSVFDKNFILEDTFIYKNCVCFDYKNIYDDQYTVQGFCIARDYCMISAYSKMWAKSRIYLYEKNGVFKKCVELNNAAHVGGISYDYINDVVFVTGERGKINAFDYNELISGSLKEYQCNVDISKVLDGSVRAATVYFYNNCLYVCTFSNVGRMVKFDIDVNKKRMSIDAKEYVVTNDLPACIQGVCVFENEGNLFYLFSQSFGNLKSIIKIFDAEFNFFGQKILENIGIEGIDLDYTGNILSVYENGVSTVKRIPLYGLDRGLKGTLEKKYVEKGRIHQNKLDKMK